MKAQKKNGCKAKRGMKEEVGVSKPCMMDRQRKKRCSRKIESKIAVAKKSEDEEGSSNWRDEIELSEDDMKGMSVKSGHKRPTKWCWYDTERALRRIVVEIQLKIKNCCNNSSI